LSGVTGVLFPYVLPPLTWGLCHGHVNGITGARLWADFCQILSGVTRVASTPDARLVRCQMFSELIGDASPSASLGWWSCQRPCGPIGIVSAFATVLFECCQIPSGLIGAALFSARGTLRVLPDVVRTIRCHSDVMIRGLSINRSGIRQCGLDEDWSDPRSLIRVSTPTRCLECYVTATKLLTRTVRHHLLEIISTIS
jgi:hypothetical protein